MIAKCKTPRRAHTFRQNLRWGAGEFWGAGVEMRRKPEKKEAVSMEETILFSDLPDEVLTLVVQYLDDQLPFSLLLACKQLKRAALTIEKAIPQSEHALMAGKSGYTNLYQWCRLGGFLSAESANRFSQGVATTGNVEAIRFAMHPNADIVASFATCIEESAGSGNMVALLDAFEHITGKTINACYYHPLPQGWRDGWISAICWEACNVGDLDALSWLVDRAGISVHEIPICASTELGHFEVLRWAHDRGVYMDEDVIRKVVEAGDLKTFEWLKTTALIIDDYPEDLVDIAAIYGHTEMMNRLLDCGFEAVDAQDRRQGVLAMAATQGCSLGHTKAVVDAGYYPLRSRFLVNATHCCRLDVLKWAFEQDDFEGKFDFDVIARNASFNSIDAKEKLEWALDNGGKLPTTACRDAATRGDNDLLLWVHSKGVQLDEAAAMRAAMYNHVDTLRLLYKMGCPLDESVCLSAAKNGSFEALRFLRARGCPWNRVDCLSVARNYPVMRHWIANAVA